LLWPNRVANLANKAEKMMVTEFSKDPMINVIHDSIRKEINVTLEHECGAIIAQHSGRSLVVNKSAK
jgi:hypothetical protein